jgi:hypothetical protein
MGGEVIYTVCTTLYISSLILHTTHTLIQGLVRMTSTSVPDEVVRDPTLNALQRTLAGGNCYLSSTYYIEKRGPASGMSQSKNHITWQFPMVSVGAPCAF